MMKKKFLFVLDLNGTLFDRVKSDKDLAKTIKNPDFYIRSDPTYKRPNLDAFLTSLFEKGDVAVWTSCQMKNATPMILNTFNGHVSMQSLCSLDNEFLSRSKSFPNIHFKDGENKLKFAWTQRECFYGGKRKSKDLWMKDIEKIWRTFPEYSSKNTMMIDDSQEKFKGNLDNLYMIPSFSIFDSSHPTDRELLKVLEAKSLQGNVGDQKADGL